MLHSVLKYSKWFSKRILIKTYQVKFWMCRKDWCCVAWFLFLETHRLGLKKSLKRSCSPLFKKVATLLRKPKSFCHIKSNDHYPADTFYVRSPELFRHLFPVYLDALQGVIMSRNYLVSKHSIYLNTPFNRRHIVHSDLRNQTWSHAHHGACW